MDALAPVLGWAAPIASTLIVTWLTALINRWMSESKKDREREEAEHKAWRASVDKKLEDQDDVIKAILSAQCTQMRSDAIHRAHRYIDDLGCASIEEKKSFYAEWEEYQAICDKYGITNNFVDNLVRQVMALPDRPRQS